jgi:tetratricopeptide (TPR) repeat protein
VSRLVRIANWSGDKRGAVVFVHGLGGHVYDTWRRRADDDTFWPLWLAEDIPGLTVYSLAYEAPASNWLGTAMPLQDRAVNILECLLSEADLASGPIVFVGHSLGGLIVKKILLDLQQQANRRSEAAALLARVTQIVFAATPHTGSSKANLLDRLRFVAWPTSIARVLAANDPALRDINVAYRGLADERRDALRHRIFYETRNTPAGVIVDEASADPGLPGDPPVPIDADHIDIVKPADRASLIYARTRQFIETGAASPHPGTIDRLALPTIASDQPLNLVPKLVRLAALLLVVVIAFKGVQALIAPDPSQIAAEQLRQKDRQIAEKDRQIAAILVALNDKRTSPAPPGGDKELRQAVASVVEGDADPRYAKAKELLAAGRPADAEPLLKAVAEEKTASAEQLNRASAAAYRDLGAIAAVTDPGRARDYYAKAAQHDPADVGGMFWNGWYQMLAGRVDAAAAAFTQVVASTPLRDSSNWGFWARLGLADIDKDHGRLQAALVAYHDLGNGIVALLKADPNDAGWQRDLAETESRVGQVQARLGHSADALRAYREGHAIFVRLAAADPHNGVFRRDLSGSFNDIGDMQLAQGDLAGALDSFRDGLDIDRAGIQSDPDNADLQRDLTVSYQKAGDVQVRQGDLAAALTSYRAAFAIANRQAKSDPMAGGPQRDLSVAFSKIGNVQVAAGDLPGALASYQADLDIAGRLAASDPTNTGWQRDFAVTLNKVGDVLAARGKLAEALDSYQRSFAIADRLAKSDPSNTEWRRDLSLSIEKVGDMQAARNEFAEALKSYREAFSLDDSLAKLDPGNADWRQDVAISLEKIGNAHAAQNDLADALESYQNAFAILDDVAKSDPSNAIRRRNLAIILNKIGIIRFARADFPAASRSYQDSFAMVAALAKSDPGNADWQHDLALGYQSLASVFAQAGDNPKAIDALRESRRILGRLTDLSPDNVKWKADLSGVDAQIAQLTK